MSTQEPVHEKDGECTQMKRGRQLLAGQSALVQSQCLAQQHNVPGTSSEPSPGQGEGTSISPPGVPGPGSLQSLKFPPMLCTVHSVAQSLPRTPLML